MSVRQDPTGNKLWYVQYYVKVNGELKQRRKRGFKFKRDALKWEREFLNKRDNGTVNDIIKEYNETFEELAEKYTEAFKGQKAFKDKRNDIEVFKRYFEGRKLKDIKPYELEMLRNERKSTPVSNGINKMKKGYKQRIKNTEIAPPRERADATVNRELSTLRHMMNKAVEWDMMKVSPFSKVKKLFYKENNQRTRFLIEDEENRLFNVLDSLPVGMNYFKQIVIVALNTGMRLGEILSLKWSQIKTREDGRQFIALQKTKTENPRQVPLNDTLKRLFATLPFHIKDGKKAELIFLNPKTQEPYKGVSRAFNGLVRKAEIENFRFHDLRHDYASKLRMRGTPLEVVQKLLGHKDIKMTLRYAHLGDDEIFNAVNLLDKKIEVNEEEGQLQICP